jgi:hypothetical protein
LRCLKLELVAEGAVEALVMAEPLAPVVGAAAQVAVY